MVPRGLPQTEVLCQAATADLEALAPALATTADGGDLLGVSWEALEERLARLEADAATLDSLPRRTVLMVRLRAAGLEPLLEDLRAREVPAAEVAAELQRCWWLSLLAAAHEASPVLASAVERRAGLLGAAARAEREGQRAAARTVAEAGAAVREQGGAVARCRVSAPLAPAPRDRPGRALRRPWWCSAPTAVGVPEAVPGHGARGPGGASWATPGAWAWPISRCATARVEPLLAPAWLEAARGTLPTVVLGTQHRMPAALPRPWPAPPARAWGRRACPTAPWGGRDRAVAGALRRRHRCPRPRPPAWSTSSSTTRAPARRSPSRWWPPAGRWRGRWPTRCARPTATAASCRSSSAAPRGPARSAS